MSVCGIDIGGTKIETAVFDQELNLIKSWRLETPTSDYREFLRVVIEQIRIAESICGSTIPVGIGMPGLINDQGKVLSANVPCATDRNVRNDITEALGRGIALKNDTRCFALSEATLGAGEGFRRVFGAIIGTGAAGGLCVDGKLEESRQGIAGEYGHLPLSAQLQQAYQLPVLTCGCGLTGCVESYIAGPGIARLYQHFTGEQKDGHFWREKLQQNDETALQILICYLDILGETFASVCKVQEPDVIVLGGGLSRVKNIAERLQQAVAQHLFTGFSAPVIKLAKFGDSSGVRGAAILARESDEF